MYKFLLLAVILSVQLSDIVGMSLMAGPPFPTSVDDSRGSRMRQYYDDNDIQGIYIPAIQEFTEDKPENKPEAQSEENPEDLENRLDNMVEKLDDLIKVTAKNRPTQSSGSTTNIVKELSSEYLVTKGIGAHKLHLRKLSWNKARKVCIDEGGQLADIRSDSEEKIVLRMLVEEAVEFAWVGYHDIFEEGDWVSVLGEPLGKSGWDRWWKKRLPNPDNDSGEEDCACLMRDGGGMNDYNCSKELPFICKITSL